MKFSPCLLYALTVSILISVPNCITNDIHTFQYLKAASQASTSSVHKKKVTYCQLLEDTAFGFARLFEKVEDSFTGVKEWHNVSLRHERYRKGFFSYENCFVFEGVPVK